MSLSSSMWTSVSGLLNHGEKMSVVSNNISNVNTVGFKSSRMDFSTFVYQNVNTNSGPAQVGRGMTIGAIFEDFSQGSFENSNEATDLAINGNGFFKVVPKNGDDAFYTRAGNFRFDAQGYLVDPNGYVLQGWEIQQPELTQASGALATTPGKSTGYIVGTGVPQDVRLASFSCDPKHTSNVSVALNLDSNCGAEKATSTTGNPYAALFEKWQGDQANPLGSDDGYMYQYSITVYDEGGTPHILSIYFDPVTENEDATNSDGDLANYDPSAQRWEFIVTMDPADDQRKFANGTVGGVPGTDVEVPDRGKGLLMSGVLSFNSSGTITDMVAYVPTEGGDNFQDPGTWMLAPISANGYPMFAANFTGQPGASDVWDPANLPSIGTPGELNSAAYGYYTELNLGFKNTTNWWDFSTPGSDVYYGDIGTGALPGTGTHGQRQQPATTCYGSSSGNNFFERYANQDGYTYGELATIYVDKNGVLSGRYSNGVTLELFQITLYNFSSLNNLRSEGGNLWSQTRESGDPTQGAAGSGSFGTIHGNSLEQSNVDLSTELVQMITTQRGFQSNSKAITTTDTMLETVINMKR